MTETKKKKRSYEQYRKDYLPEQLDRARRRYQGLVREAKRMKMYWVLTNTEMFDMEDAA